MTSQSEIERRYQVLRQAMEAAGVDALVVSGSEYTGFDGGLRYVSGFRIVHRYAYVVLPLDGDPVCLFPKEARWVGEHAEPWIEAHEFPDVPGEWIREQAAKQGWRRIGVFGLDYIMPVRDYRALADGDVELVGFDREFDEARAAKSEEELALVRDSLRINEEGFWALLRAYEPGKTQAQLMAVAEALFVERGTGRRTMNMVLSGRNGAAEPEFRIPDHERPVAPDDLLLYSLEIAGPGGYWTEFARPLIRGDLSDETARMFDAYQECFERARASLTDGATAHDVHRAVSEPLEEGGYPLGHVTGHSIGMTMIEFPRIGEGEQTVLRENMVISIHPHVISPDGRSCLYMQETFRVGRDASEQLTNVPVRIFHGTER